MMPARWTVPGTLALLVALGLGAGAALPPPPASAGSDGPAVRILLEERQAALKEIAALIERLHATGRATAAELRAANRAVHRAELDLCETAEARAAVLEKMLAEAKAQERDAELARQAGMGTAVEALDAKVDRLEIQIELEQIRAG